LEREQTIWEKQSIIICRIETNNQLANEENRFRVHENQLRKNKKEDTYKILWH